MAVSSSRIASASGDSPLKVFWHSLIYMLWTWRIMLGYLVFMLFLLTAVMLAKSSGLGPAEFWRIVTSDRPLDLRCDFYHFTYRSAD